MLDPAAVPRASLAGVGKRVLGGTLLLLGGLVLTGVDKRHGAAAVGLPPDRLASF